MIVVAAVRAASCVPVLQVLCRVVLRRQVPDRALGPAQERLRRLSTFHTDAMSDGLPQSNIIGHQRTKDVVSALAPSRVAVPLARPAPPRQYKMGYSNSSFLVTSTDPPPPPPPVTRPGIDRAPPPRPPITTSAVIVRPINPAALPSRPSPQQPAPPMIPALRPQPLTMPEVLFSAPKVETCVACGKEAQCKCSNCVVEFYCGRDCQVKVCCVVCGSWSDRLAVLVRAPANVP